MLDSSTTEIEIKVSFDSFKFPTDSLTSPTTQSPQIPHKSQSISKEIPLKSEAHQLELVITFPFGAV